MAHTIAVSWQPNGLLRIEVDAAIAHELADKLSYVPRSTELGMLMEMVGDRLIKPKRRKGDVEETGGGQPPTAG